VCPAASVLGFLIGENGGLLRFVTGVVTPVGLHEHGVDLFEINGFGAVTHGFDEGSDTEVSHGPQDALGDAQDDVEGVVGEGVVRQAGLVQLGVHVGFEGVGGEGFEFGGVALLCHFIMQSIDNKRVMKIFELVPTP